MPAPNQQGPHPQEPSLAEKLAAETAAAVARVRAQAAWVHAAVMPTLAWSGPAPAGDFFVRE
jgi:hypothetical protein